MSQQQQQADLAELATITWTAVRLGRTSKSKRASTAAETAFVILRPEKQLENLEGRGRERWEVKGGPQESNPWNKKKATKIIQGLEKVPYSISLSKINLFSFSERRLRSDLIDV